MINNYISELLNSWIPNLTYNLPVFGQVDLTSTLTALIVFVGLTLLFWLIRHVVLIRLKRLARHTDTGVDDVAIAAVQHVHVLVYTIAALYISLQAFDISGKIGQAIDAVF